MRTIGVNFEVRPVHIDESVQENESARDYVTRLAEEKADAALVRFGSTQPILAADTIVALNNRLFGKPKDLKHFRSMMRELSGGWHQVLTGVAFKFQQQTEVLCCQTEVCFGDLDEATINAYWHTGEPMDKAGGYAIQGIGSQFVREIRGSYSNVVGLPLFEVAEILRGAGIPGLINFPKGSDLV